MKDFVLGLDVAGQIQYVLAIRASTLRAAKTEWARLTGHLDNVWDKRTQTYCGWHVRETSIKPLERKTPTGFFSY